MINGEVFNKVNMVVYNNMEYTKWMTYKHLMALVTFAELKMRIGS